jgi:hypothetical protein
MSSLRAKAVLLAIAVVTFGAGAVAASAADQIDPLYPGVGPAGGLSFYVNPTVPAGYDADRYLAVVQRSLARWGDTYLGLTTTPPGTGDDVNVIGFSAGLPDFVTGLHQLRTRSVLTTTPGARTCSTVRVLKRVTIKVRKRVRVRRVRTVVVEGQRLRRARWVRVVRRVPKRVLRRVPVERCTQAPPVQRWETVAENDILLDDSTVWQMGPDYPDASTVDFETVLLHELGHASGLDHTLEPCSTTSPMPAATYSGDWWRGPADYSLANCLAANGAAASTAAVARSEDRPLLK